MQAPLCIELDSYVRRKEEVRIFGANVRLRVAGLDIEGRREEIDSTIEGSVAVFMHCIEYQNAFCVYGLLLLYSSVRTAPAEGVNVAGSEHGVNQYAPIAPRVRNRTCL